MALTSRCSKKSSTASMAAITVAVAATPAAFLASAAPFLREGREFLLLGLASMAATRFPAAECFVVKRQRAATEDNAAELGAEVSTLVALPLSVSLSLGCLQIARSRS